MNNTSTRDNFEAIASDTMDLLVATLSALTADEDERRAVKLLVSLAAQSICTRAIALD
jgi:hypothetical protein